MTGRTTDFFWRPVLPHKCGVPVDFGTPHLCGREDFCRAHPMTQLSDKQGFANET
jgi:hypothetical protein